MEIGLPIGTRIPEFQARDQREALQTFHSLRGPGGLAMTLVRSVDW
jgi:hypothetical protein